MKKMLEKKYLKLNGIQQGFIIERHSMPEAPVLLFVHGCTPIIPFAWKHQMNLNKIFHVCYWDQRWTGMSCSLPNNQAFEIEQLKNDTLVITQHLIDLFQQNKIYILGHSWGSYLASLVVQEQPSYFYAYLGVGQIGDMRKSERDRYKAILQEAETRNDKKALHKINRLSISDDFFDTFDIGHTSFAYSSMAMKYTEKYGFGFIRDGYPNGKIFKTVFSCGCYTLSEKFGFFKGLFQSSEHLIGKILNRPLQKVVPEYKIPIHIFQGKYDYTTSFAEAKRFFESVKAPKKSFTSFENSAHSPFIDEKDKFNQLLSALNYHIQ
jgi:pimeloyl-ACP methyl ester carboxylesterase